DDLADAIDRRRHQGLVGLGRQDEHALVLPQRSPPLVWTAPREGEQVGMRAVHEGTGTARAGSSRRALPSSPAAFGLRRSSLGAPVPVETITQLVPERRHGARTGTGHIEDER